MTPEHQATGKHHEPPRPAHSGRKARWPLTPFQLRRQRTICFDALLAFIVAVVLIDAREWFEKHTELGQEVELFTYDWVQKLLASRRTDEKISIAIVDLSLLPPKPIPGAGKGEMATPREGVEELLKSLVDLKPLAIGVDVDFSPRVYLDSSPPRSVFITPLDPKFFEDCLKLSNDEGVPIYLGISRTQALPHSEWLLRPEYAKLGASILAPRFESERMLKCFQRPSQAECGPTLSEALAKHLPPAEHHFVDYFPRIFTPVSRQKISDNISVGAFPVDYSRLEQLKSRDHTVWSIQAEALREAQSVIEGSVVLVGDAKPESGPDQFPVPGRRGLQPGIYVHACAIYTLSKAPLYQFTQAGRWLVDLLLAAFVILVPTGARWYYNSRSTPEIKHQRLQGALTLAAILLVVTVAAGLVHRTRLLWDDFLLVVFAFAMHPSCERHLKALGGWLRRAVPKAWHQFLFGPEKKHHP